MVTHSEQAVGDGRQSMVLPAGGVHVWYGLYEGEGGGAATGCRAMTEAAVIANRRRGPGGGRGMVRMGGY
jgi:hypothetical protein